MSYIFQKRKAWVYYMNNRSRPQNKIACPKAPSWQPGTYKMELLKRQTSFLRNSPKCSHTTFFLDLHAGYRFQSSVAIISIVIVNHMIVGVRIIEPQAEHVQPKTLQPAPCLQPLSLGNVLWVREPFKLVKVKVLVTQPCLTLCNPMDNSSPSSSLPEILQARILEWVAIPFSRGIFSIQGSNPGLPQCRWILYHLSHQGSSKLDSQKTLSIILQKCLLNLLFPTYSSIQAVRPSLTSKSPNNLQVLPTVLIPFVSGLFLLRNT